MTQVATAVQTPASARPRPSLFDELSERADNLMTQLNLPEWAQPTARSFFVTACLIKSEQDNTDGACWRKAVKSLRTGTELLIKIKKTAKGSFQLLVRQQMKGSQWVDVTRMLDDDLRLALAVNLDGKKDLEKPRTEDFLLIDRRSLIRPDSSNKRNELKKTGDGWLVLCEWIEQNS